MYKYLTNILITLTLLTGCEPEWQEPYQNYIIKQGEHYSTYKQSSLLSESLNFAVRFDSSAVYTSPTIENQHDINKLLGFSDCNSLHHQNSARFGWRWLEGQLEIHAYCYVNGLRMSEYIGTVQIGAEVLYSLQITDNEYIFSMSGHQSISMPRGNICDQGLYYTLWPYFGGDETAPHDITIQIKMLY